MSGASGKVPAAIHVSPEAVDGGVIGKVQDGDMIRLDAEKGVLEVKAQADELTARSSSSHDLAADRWGTAESSSPGYVSLSRTLKTGR